MMDLPRLRMLMAVQDEGSITGAARTLNYTAAAVSQQMSKLERETGLSLITRHSRGVTLTSPGEELVVAGRDVLARLALAEDSARQLAGLERAKLRIATFQSASAGLLPKILAPLSQRFPRMSVEFVQVPRAEALHLLRQYDADVALVHEHPESPGDMDLTGLSLEFLFADALRLVTAPRHPAAHWQEPVDLAQLHQQDLIVGRVEDDDRYVLDALFDELEVLPVHVAEVGEYFVAAAMASSGIAVTLMPELAIPTGYSLVTKRLNRRLERRVFLITRQNEDHAAVDAFRRTTFEVIERMPPAFVP
ncbi:MAG: LysR family transcriptional regulator [Brevibacterium sp.]|nr:LysR family transcriptional regulator [Brevibacterium sp.]MDN5875333.1 LysR family transcriptional regulator [Brevibacterium sp.]MDN5908005.1 LysR family transcriptional regulator [Brevibacterium sp.]MDN6123629.1 LysR family transcriptional regulator [Brevibacterium sp.]MDN6135446.1 LysR family transcriptional regulator [Brevibacterium sp.]